MPETESRKVTLWECPAHGLIEDKWLGWTEDEEGHGTLIYYCSLCPDHKVWTEGELVGPLPALIPQEGTVLVELDREVVSSYFASRSPRKSAEALGQINAALREALRENEGEG